MNWIDPKGLENFDPMTGIPTDIMQPIYDWFNDMFGEKPPAPPSTFDKIADGLCTDIPEALRGFGNGLDRLNNLDRNNMSPLEEGLFDYLYINQKRVLNESETPINLIDKVETVNDFNNMRK